MDEQTLEMMVFTRKVADWLGKQALVDPKKLVTRKMVADALPHRRLRDIDFDDDATSGTAYRTARDPSML
jgi:hypothetical protein